ncbi:MAG: hypothetical protein EXS39_03885 [Opitutaceae bacterium]|nr:hypothetical protein [Opitutaceae bacterium]
MRRRIRPLLPLLLALLTGCSMVSTNKKPGSDLAQLKHVFVEHRLNDNHGIDQLIVRELQNLGRAVSCGPLTMLPENADAIITYEDDWAFDFTTHMIVLDVKVRAAHTDEMLVTGHYINRGVTRMPPERIVHDVVTSMFQPD